MTLYVSHPQMSGGKMRTSGGMSHSGTEANNAAQATTVDPKDHVKLSKKDPPFFRSRALKRRWATRDTNAGVISIATNNKAVMTMSGVMPATTNNGAT